MKTRTRNSCACRMLKPDARCPRHRDVAERIAYYRARRGWRARLMNWLRRHESYTRGVLWLALAGLLLFGFFLIESRALALVGDNTERVYIMSGDMEAPR